MKLRTWQTLTLITMALIALLVLLNSGRNSNGEFEVHPAFPQLEEKFDSVSKIQIRTHSDSVTLEKQNNRWLVAEKNHYPVASGLLRKELLGLAELKLLEAKTKKPENYAQLGVQDVDQSGTESVEIKLFTAENTTIAQLIVGKGSDTSGAYVRLNKELQSWLASAKPNFSSKPQDWLDKELTKLDVSRIKSVRVTPSSGASFSLTRINDTADIVFDDIPKGKKAKDGEVRRFASGLSSLSLEDVTTLSTNIEKATRNITFETSDGLIIEANLYKKESGIFATLTAHSQTNAIPTAVTEAQQLNAKWKGWLYQLPNYQGETLLLTRDALLESATSSAHKK